MILALLLSHGYAALVEYLSLFSYNMRKQAELEWLQSLTAEDNKADDEDPRSMAEGN